MGLMDFVKEAGEALFVHGRAQAAMTEAKVDPSNDAKIQAASFAAGDAIIDYIKSQNLSATGLTVTFDGAIATASVFGVAPDQATKEKIALCCSRRRQGLVRRHDAREGRRRTSGPGRRKGCCHSDGSGSARTSRQDSNCTDGSCACRWRRTRPGLGQRRQQGLSLSRRQLLRQD
jgi:hypothetical protein